MTLTKLTTWTRIFTPALLLLLLVSLPMASNALANDGISLDYKNVELTDLIKTISELTGRNFVYDEQVRGKVSIISPQSMSVDEAYQLFLTVLNVKGFTLIEKNNINKIISIKDAKESNLPTFDKVQGENYVTQLIRLEYADAQALATSVLLPLIPKTSNLSVYEPTNTLILTDNAANIDRLLSIIKKLDIPTGLDQLEVFTLKQADAEEVAQIANTLINNQPKPRRAKNAALAPQAQVIAYPRTNTLLAIGSADEITLLRSLIKNLDTPGEQARSSINVYYLKNADAEELATSLNEIMLGTRRVAAAKKDKTAIEPLVITADKPTNSLLISASPADYNALVQVIKKLDIQRKQVFVEALILELSMDATREIGAALQGAIDLGSESVTLGTSNLNSSSVGSNSVGLGDFLPGDNGIPTLLGRSVQGLMLGGLFNPITITGPDGSTMTVPAVSALLQLSQTSRDVNVLSAPQLLTSDNEEAEIVVGENVPIITSRLTDTGGSTGLAQSVTVERQDAALTLRFTPQVTEGDLVRLDVFQEITAVISENENTGPTLNKRQLRNTVLAEDGKTVVLGGLIGTDVEKNDFKVPLLGDIPLLGRLFRSSGTTTKKTNLLIFMTPRIIRNASEMVDITQRARITSQTMQSRELKESISGQNFMIDLSKPENSEATNTHE